MELCIIRTTSFDKHLNLLCKTGKRGALAAGRAELIIENLPRIPWHSPEILCRRTKKGELRIKNCEKYDLGGGYRLICTRKGKHLFLLFVGTHDDCDRWLENNKGMEPEIDINDKSISFKEKASLLIETFPDEAETDIDVYEQELLEKIDDKTLRYIFRGLYKK
ncbi:MAG: hypothetical protein K9K37_12475 [Desulfocapsa sp.]|nr:hypothetical protein [Desulfocapsa sp.]